jgi:predicted Fe-Mo cluster-binding NifX family protein
MSKLIAVPSADESGLESLISSHFGKCQFYTLVSLNDDGEIEKAETLNNIPHEHGGCLAPVQHLGDNGVNVLIAGGMGMRPLMHFEQTGIEVFHAGEAETVKEAISMFAAGNLSKFIAENTCSGG